MVVIGAGAAGVPCALAAADAGAKLRLFRKRARRFLRATRDSLRPHECCRQGCCVSWLTEQCAWRSHRDQLELWANNSGEALHWLWDKATEAGCQVVDTTKKMDEQHLGYRRAACFLFRI